MADKKTEQFYTRPPKLGKWEGFKVFLWNSETHQFLGRTGSSWGKIILFYLIFYIVLIGFFAAMLTVFYQTLDAKEPKWKLESSLIGKNPGLGFRPMPPPSNVESTLIWYKSSDKGNVIYWRDEMNKFLETYDKDKKANQENIVTCVQGIQPAENKVCDVAINTAPCVPETMFNYNESKYGPCIFLKLNKIFGWIPDYYTVNDKLPDNMPPNVIDNIQKTAGTKEEEKVWVSCEGENPADIENVGTGIHYYPLGFSGEYFPFTNVAGYLSPVVAVYFEEPTRGVLINIECKAWAKNIIHDRYDRRGSVHFELMID